jgi:hypothetical protein
MAPIKMNICTSPSPDIVPPTARLYSLYPHSSTTRFSWQYRSVEPIAPRSAVLCHCDIPRSGRSCHLQEMHKQEKVRQRSVPTPHQTHRVHLVWHSAAIDIAHPLHYNLYSLEDLGAISTAENAGIREVGYVCSVPAHWRPINQHRSSIHGQFSVALLAGFLDPLRQTRLKRCSSRRRRGIARQPMASRWWSQWNLWGSMSAASVYVPLRHCTQLSAFPPQELPCPVTETAQTVCASCGLRTTGRITIGSEGSHSRRA